MVGYTQNGVFVPSDQIALHKTPAGMAWPYTSYLHTSRSPEGGRRADPALERGNRRQAQTRWRRNEKHYGRRGRKAIISTIVVAFFSFIMSSSARSVVPSFLIFHNSIYDFTNNTKRRVVDIITLLNLFIMEKWFRRERTDVNDLSEKLYEYRDEVGLGLANGLAAMGVAFEELFKWIAVETFDNKIMGYQILCQMRFMWRHLFFFFKRDSHD